MKRLLSGASGRSSVEINGVGVDMNRLPFNLGSRADRSDLALSDFIDGLPLDPEEARSLYDEVAPLSGDSDLAELAQLAMLIRTVPPPEPRPEWFAATKQRLLTAPKTSLKDQGDVVWLGSMFVPPTKPAWPSFDLGRLAWVKTASLAAVVILEIAARH